MRLFRTLRSVHNHRRAHIIQLYRTVWVHEFKGTVQTLSTGEIEFSVGTGSFNTRRTRRLLSTLRHGLVDHDHFKAVIHDIAQDVRAEPASQVVR